MAGFIPAHPAELTPEWVTEAMRGAGALAHGTVARVAVEPIGDGGTGFTGETVRVRLRYEGTAADAPETVVAKFATPDRQNRGMLEQFDAYAREIRFYQRYGSRVPCAVPGYLGADYDRRGAKRAWPLRARLIDALPERVQLLMTRDVTRFMRSTKRRYALLLEDLGGQTVVHDMVDPPSLDQIAAALDALAALHADFWDDASLDGDDVFRVIVTDTPGLYQTVGRRRCLALGRARWEWFGDHHAASIADALDRFPADVAAINTKLTMIHGDPRADNLLYRPDGDVVLLDWALAGHAHPGFDVGYLLSSCVREDDVDGLERLIEGYQRGLVDRGIAVDGEDLRAVVEATYRAQAVQQLMSISVLQGGYGEQHLADIWMPRILAGLDRLV